MFKFDTKNKILEIKQVKDLDIELDLLRAHKESYRKFKEVTIHKLIERLCNLISETTGINGLSVTSVIEKKELVDLKEIIDSTNTYYSVIATFNYNGVNLPPVEVTRIPYMDNYCVFNIEGSRKSIWCELANIEDISYEEKKSKVVVNFPNNSFSLLLGKSVPGIDIQIYKRKLKHWYALKSMMKSSGFQVDLSSYFSNPILIASLGDDDATKDETIEMELDKTKFIQNIESDEFKLGRLRDSFNRRFTIDKCLGHILSRDVKLGDTGQVIPKGAFVTEELLELMKRFLVNEVYIKVIPNVEGRRFTGFIANKLPKGIRMTELVAELLEDDETWKYDGNSRLSEDIEGRFIINEGTKLTSDILKLLYDIGATEIDCYGVGKASEIITYKFEQEIIGNYTAQLKDFLEEIPEGYSGDEYTYYYGQENPYDFKGIVSPEKMTVHDMLALVSYTARVESFPEFNETDNREYDLLKKINLYNEIFSNAFRDVMFEYVDKYKIPISKFIKDGYSGLTDLKNPFRSFYQSWRHALDLRKVVHMSNDTSPMSILSQANKISTFVKDDSAVPKEMRSLAMGFYSRICPYETPSGKKIGLVNTIAVGCRIEDGVMKAPYRKIVKDERGARLTDHIDYLTVQEEQKCIIGDILSIKTDEDGYIIDEVINARVPSPVDRKEKVKFELTNSTELQYVNAFSNQHLSPMVYLIVYAACNDGARIAFGAAQYSQAIYIQDSDEPIVFTDMYTHMFEYGNDFLIKAKSSGEVIEIDDNLMILRYDPRTEYQKIITTEYDVKVGDTVKFDQIISTSPIIRAKENGVVESIIDNVITLRFDIPEREETVALQETKILNDCLIMMNLRVKEGDRFNKDDILMDTASSRGGYFSPGANEFVIYAIWGGYNYEDAIVPTINGGHKYISVSSRHAKKSIDESKSRAIIEGVRDFKFIPEKGVIAEIKRRNLKDKNLESVEKWTSGSTSGILYKIDSEKEVDKGNNMKKYVAKFINYNRLEEADKMAGRHGNKGVTGLMCPDSKMYTFKNGRRARMALNPAGVVSRMNGGQNMEAHTGFIGYISRCKIKTNPFNGASREDLEILMSLMYDIANTYDIRTASGMSAIKEIYVPKGIPVSYLEHCVENYESIKEWEDCFERDGTAQMYDPAIGDYLPFRVAFGVSYMLKIHQEVRDKMHSRAGMLTEPYVEVTGQPTEGSSKSGGQKMGEMEAIGVASHACANIMDETMNELSDNLGKRAELHAKALHIDDVEVDERDKVPRSVNLFRYFSEAEGINVTSNFLPEVTQDEVEKMKKYSPQEMVELTERSTSETKVYKLDKFTLDELDGQFID